MILKRLSIVNYKNIVQAETVFSPKINCFFGNNGMGKTNLMDAIYYLSFCKSHLNTPDSQIIRNGEEMCVLQGWYDYEGRGEELFCAIRRKQRKQFNSLYEVSYSPRRLKGWSASLALGLDRGNYLGNSTGGMLVIRKSGVVF